MNRIFALMLSIALSACVFTGCRRAVDQAMKDTTTGTTVDSTRPSTTTVPETSAMPSTTASEPDVSTPSADASMPTSEGMTDATVSPAEQMPTENAGRSVRRVPPAR